MMFWKRSATLQIGSRRYDMSNLYFEFDVPFKDSDTLGTASITVHNLAEATRKEIVKGTPVILNAGYEGDIGVIFTGKVSTVIARNIYTIAAGKIVPLVYDNGTRYEIFFHTLHTRPRYAQPRYRYFLHAYHYINIFATVGL